MLGALLITLEYPGVTCGGRLVNVDIGGRLEMLLLGLDTVSNRAKLPETEVFGAI